MHLHMTPHECVSPLIYMETRTVTCLAGRCLGAAYLQFFGLFSLCKERNRMLHPAEGGGLAIYKSCGLCCFVFALSWSRKFLTLQSPPPSLQFKARRFSQHVGPLWSHLGFDSPCTHTHTHLLRICVSLDVIGYFVT